MTNVILVILGLAVVGLAANQAVQAKRIKRIRKRFKRSMHVGPEDHLRLQKQVYDQMLRVDCAAAGLKPRMAPEFRSEWGEDTLLYELFRGQTAGVYIEVGALDGKRCSISWVFDAIGWSGLLAEAVPEMYKRCVKNRPYAKIVQAALAAKGSTGTTEFMVPVDDEKEPSPSSYRAHEGMGTDHIAMIEKTNAQVQKVVVPLSWMDVELERAGFTKVDFAVIDVEGGELDLLRGFDLAKWRPRVLVVEDNSLGKDNRVLEHMRGAGYESVMWIGANRVYIRGDDSEMRGRCARVSETVYSPFVKVKNAHGNEDHRLG